MTSSARKLQVTDTGPSFNLFNLCARTGILFHRLNPIGQDHHIYTCDTDEPYH